MDQCRQLIFYGLSTVIRSQESSYDRRESAKTESARLVVALIIANQNWKAKAAYQRFQP